jgi:hypothetical protein
MSTKAEKYRRVTLYDCEKNDKTGYGNHVRYIRRDQFKGKKMENEVKRIKDEQTKINEEYRQKNPVRTKINIIKSLANFTPPEKPQTQQLTNLDIKFDEGTGNTIYILGSSKMGKSTLLMYIYNKYYSNPKYITTLFTINYHIKTYVKDKNLMICKTFDKNAEKVIKMEKYINTKTANHYDFVNIFDDILDIRYNKLLNDMVMTYRNSNVSSIISLQYTHLLSKGARANVNNIVCFGFNTEESIITVIKTFLKTPFTNLGYTNETQQINFYKDMTKDHGFIYIHPVSQTISFHKLSL